MAASVQGGLTQIFSHDRSTWVAPRFPSGYLVVEVDRRCVLNCTAINDPAPKIQSCRSDTNARISWNFPLSCWFRRGHDGMIYVFFSLLYFLFVLPMSLDILGT